MSCVWDFLINTNRCICPFRISNLLPFPGRGKFHFIGIFFSLPPNSCVSAFSLPFPFFLSPIGIHFIYFALVIDLNVCSVELYAISVINNSPAAQPHFTFHFLSSQPNTFPIKPGDWEWDWAPPASMINEAKNVNFFPAIPPISQQPSANHLPKGEPRQCEVFAPGRKSRGESQAASIMH